MNSGRCAISPEGGKETEFQGVVFDVDGTLYPQWRLYAAMGIYAALLWCVHPIRTSRQLRILIHYRCAQEWLRVQPTGSFNSETQMARTAETARFPLSEIINCIAYWTGRVPLRFLPVCANRKVTSLIRRWHELGIPMAVYSDYPARDKLQALGITPFISAVLSSTDAEVAALKPNTRGFMVAAEKLGLSPEHIAYLGDRRDTDSVGARNSGMYPIMIKDKFSVEGNGCIDSIEFLDRQFSKTYRSKCWICGEAPVRDIRPSTIRQGIDAAAVRISDSHYGEAAALVKCSRCGFIFADPLPYADLTDLYREMDDEAYLESAPARRIQMRRILDAITHRYPQARRILDIGAGTGLLVSEAQGRGLHAEGVEPSGWLVEAARNTNGTTLFHGTLEEFSKKAGLYDIITLIDVVEHTDHPLQLMRQAAERLAPGGILVVVTPDAGSLTARLMGRHWWHYRVAHVGYFGRRTMRLALKKIGMGVLSDSFIGWRFPLAYLCERVTYYLPFPGKVLEKISRYRAFDSIGINLNLRDSRMYIARRMDI